MKLHPCRLLVGGAALCLLVGFVGAVSMAGSASDSLISLSYIENQYTADVTATTQKQTYTALTQAMQELEEQLVRLEARYSENFLVTTAAAAFAPNAATMSLTQGETVTTALGTELCLTAGQATLTEGTLINLTAGSTVTAGTSLVLNARYLSPESGSVVTADENGVRFSIAGAYTTGESTAYQARYQSYAEALHALGLFQGTDKGYELTRIPTRAEGLVLLIRLMGKEDEALAFTGTHPFQDVAAWADRYVAYAYQNGLTNGISATQFGSTISLRANDYMTFLLRALDYSDSKGDFSWASALDTAAEVGILSALDAQVITANGALYRDDVAYTSFRTLGLLTKDGSETLADRLIRAGVFTRDQLSDAENFLN